LFSRHGCAIVRIFVSRRAEVIDAKRREAKNSIHGWGRVGD
jgi:hypothetical protein